MNRQQIFRIVLDIVIAVAIMEGWWFIALPLALAGAWSLPYFIEMIAAGIAYDSLFGLVPGTGFWGYAGTILSAVLFLVVIAIKKFVRK